MKNRLLAIALVLVAGCVTPSAVLVNDQGQIVDCHAAGFGIISGTMAQNRFETCYSTAQMNGYVEADRAGVTGILLQDGAQVTVSRVLPGSPAAGAGVLPGDTVMRINDLAVTSAAQARSLLFSDPGTAVQVTFARGGPEQTADIVRVPFALLARP